MPSNFGEGSDDLAIKSLTGGQNDTDGPLEIQDDEVVTAQNVEWFYSAFGERRQGCDPLDVSSPFVGQDSVVHLSQWFPSSDITNPELFGIGAKPGKAGTVPVIQRRYGTDTGTPQWSAVVPMDALTPANPDIYEVLSQAVNSKLFFGYNSTNNFLGSADQGYNRFHVWDGAGLRRTGIFQPAAIAAPVNEGSGGFAAIRYYRVRYIRQNTDGTIATRSEPSLVTSFTPSGIGAGVTVTRPALVNEGETHWELEASTDNANFYRIVTQSISITTYNDENAGGYAGTFTLSDAIGAYLLQPAARFVAADDDRILLAGSYIDPKLNSTVYWSPRKNDPGVGNDERQPIVDTGGTAIITNLNLDPADGGGITGITNGINGAWYVFKQSMIFKMIRTLDVTRAYEALELTKSRGALKGSVFQGMDAYGDTVIYFLDPIFGPSMINQAGVQQIKGLRSTWLTVNQKASSVVARGVYYTYKQQAHWWVASVGSNTPNLKLVLQSDDMKPHPDGGYHRGWSTANGRIAQALCVSLYNEWVTEGSNTRLSSRPFIGLTSPDFIQRTDVDNTDAGVTYNATIVTKPYAVESILQKFGPMVGEIVGDANSGVTTLKVRLIRDMALETSTAITVSLAPTGSETIVFNLLNDFTIDNCKVLQIQVSDT